MSGWKMRSEELVIIYYQIKMSIIKSKWILATDKENKEDINVKRENRRKIKLRIEVD